MRVNPELVRIAVLLAVCASGARAQSPIPIPAVDLAQKKVVDYLGNLADLSCKETVLQEKLGANGHVDTSERSNYDYFVLIEGDAENFQLTESRSAVGNGGVQKHGLLITNGFSTLLLVFHPYYRNSFQFTPEAETTLDGQRVIPIRFAHIPGGRTPAALAVRGRDYALELHGTAWIDPQTGQVMKMEASLEHDMSDVGLRALKVLVEYEWTERGKGFKNLVLPVSAVVDVQSLRQHWRNTHTFNEYKTFSTSAVQDDNVKIVPAEESGSGDHSPSVKEKP